MLSHPDSSCVVGAAITLLLLLLLLLLCRASSFLVERGLKDINQVRNGHLLF
eukprot:SAG25_NODE_344_length_9418_cov_328.220815_5_plen_52_part_00